MRLVQHLSHDPQNPNHLKVLRPSKRFTKSWSIQNTGTCTWDPGYSIVYESGNHAAAEMDSPLVVTHGQTAPSETYTVEVRLVSPSEYGFYQGYWRMRNAAGTYFGDRLPVSISVAAPRPTIPPTWTPRPVTTIQFNTDQDRIARGECAVLSWSVSNARAAYVYQEGEAWEAHGVPFAGQRTVCPLQTTSYSIRVVRHNDWEDLRRVVVHVVQPVEMPQIARFSVEPAYLSAGECVTARWEISGQVTRVRLLRGGEVWWADAPLIGSLYDCPPGAGQIAYTIEATGPGGTTSTQRTVYIDVIPSTTPVPLAGTAWQVLAIGGSAPAGPPITVIFEQVARGQSAVSGWGSCNSYRAVYQQNGSTLNIGSSTVGDKVCAAAASAQEQALLDALRAATSFSRGNGQLVLRDSRGRVVLNLATIESATP
jgi:heat shock protein HslJ